MFRRVKIFDENNEFNFNDRYESLGSSLMKVMLREVENLLGQKHNKSWTKQRHEQLIYDFRNQNTPEFRLVCTTPNLLDDETKNKFMSLDLPGFSIPSIDDLEKRATLDRFLSQALQVPMEKAPDGSERLVCIDDNSFVLTLDFTIKLLCLHERVTCGIPCIIEGETGVSKTALTNMYSILINSSVQAVAKLETERDLKAILSHLQGKGLINENFDEHVTVHERLKMILTGTSKNTIYDDTELGQIMFHLLNKSIRSRDSRFQDCPTQYSSCDSNHDTKEVENLLNWFSESKLHQTFFEINIDASLNESDILQEFKSIQDVSEKLIDSKAIVIVFLDGKLERFIFQN